MLTIYYWITLVMILVCMIRDKSLPRGGSARYEPELNILLGVRKATRFIDYLFCFLFISELFIC